MSIFATFRSARLVWLCPLWLLSASLLAAELPEYSKVYDPSRDPFADGKAAIQLAGASNRRVLIKVGGDWCAWCHILERAIQDNPELQRYLEQHFVLLKVNVSSANENAAFMQGLPRLQGYPQLFVADKDGQILQAQDPGEFFVNGTYDADLILKFLQKWAPTSG